MRVLLVNQFFRPDPAPTGRLLADVANYLAEQGEEVMVICGRACYTAGKRTHTAEADFVHPGVRVIRVRGLPFSHGPASRLASWLSFFGGTFWHGLRIPKPDIVLTLTTPPLLSLLGTALKLRGARHFIWEMDLYPDVATSLNAIRPGSWIDRSLGAAADCSRRRAERVIALGGCMRRRLIARGIPAEKIEVVENWVDGSKVRLMRPVRDGRLKILYSGNLGLAHDTETITRAILQLAGHPRIAFTFAGGGPRRKALEETCRQHAVSNVAFVPYCDDAHLSEHFAACDIGLVTQSPATLGCVVPSKAYALMAAGRPILYIGPSDSTTGLMIERTQCGWQVNPGGADDVMDLLKTLAVEPDLVRDAGSRAYAAFCNNYDLPQGAARIAEILGIPSAISVTDY